MAQAVSKTRSFLAGKKTANRLVLTQITDQAVFALAKIGIVFDHATVMDQIHHLNRAGAFNATAGAAMDASFAPAITTPSLPTPIQFLQVWLPGFVKTLTAARKIDVAIGIKTVGSWEDAEIVQGMIEPAGTVTEYGDMTAIPLSSWNTAFERRTIVRGEMGMAVGMLEEGRAAAMRLNSAETKRQGAAIQLEIFRNAIGFYGWNSANNRTFGLLNDPNMLAFISSSVAGGWNSAAGTFAAITGDIRMAVVQLRVQSQDQIDPINTETTLLLPTSKVDYLSVTTDFGISVADWIKQTYPKMRIESCPELQAANTNADVFYLYADEVDSSVDGSSDGGETFAQLVQTKFMTVGVEKRAKSYVEDYANASAGTLCKRPYAVVRVTGI